MWRNNTVASVFLVFALAGQAGTGTAVAQPMPAVQCHDRRVLLETPSGVVDIMVEVADTAERRATGLMHRQDLPKGQGMLFIYETPQKVSFWMRNTLIPLDMVFLDESGLIRHIHRNAQPLDETPIPGALPGDPEPNRLMVLEIAGGEAARLGLKPGQMMAHPALDDARAAWPCS
nr:DUF192 domain-containing protein [Paracoccus saliphilus]